MRRAPTPTSRAQPATAINTVLQPAFALVRHLRNNRWPVSPYFSHPLILILWSVAIGTLAVFSMLTASNIATYRALAQPALRLYTGFTATGALLTACVVLSFVPMPALLKSHVFRLMWVFGPIGLAFWVWSVVTFADCDTRWLRYLSVAFFGVGTAAFSDLVVCEVTGQSALYTLTPEPTEAVALLASGNVLKPRAFAAALGATLILLALITTVSLIYTLLRAPRVDVTLVVGVVVTLILICAELGMVLAKSRYTIPLLFVANVVEAMRIAWASRERVFSELQQIRSAQSDQAVLLESQLRQLERNAELAQLGQHTAELSHDIRNPLTAVLGSLDLIETSLKNKPPQVVEAVELLASTRNALDHVLELVRNITRQARESQPTFEPVALTRVVSSAVALCQHRLRDLTVHLELGTEELRTMGHQTQLVQVFVNLLVNACDAVRGQTDAWVRIYGERSEKTIHLRIVDSGKRPPDTLLDKMFTTRFTTGTTEASTGLGLTICAQIIRQHHGHIFVDRKASNTTIVLELPRCYTAARSAA